MKPDEEKPNFFSEILNSILKVFSNFKGNITNFFSSLFKKNEKINQAGEEA